LREEVIDEQKWKRSDEWNGKEVMNGMEREVTIGIEKKVTGKVEGEIKRKVMN
jgi:hypothetical protein